MKVKVTWRESVRYEQEFEIPDLNGDTGDDGGEVIDRAICEQADFTRVQAVEEREVLDVTAVPRPAAPRVEVIVIRDPDGLGADVTVFVDGEPVTADEYVVDAGAGWTWEGWVEHRDCTIRRASENVRPEVIAAFDAPPGGQWVDGRDDPWLHGVKGA